MEWLILGLGFGSVATLGLAGYPKLITQGKRYLERSTREASLKMEDMFMTVDPKRLVLMYVMPPFVLGMLFLLSAGKLWLGVVGAVLGLVFPKFWLKFMKINRLRQFNNQLVDCLLLLSSCLKAGLSVPQAFTVVAEEMPAPSGQEFGLVLKELRMGVNLDEALLHLKQRIVSDDLNLFVTAVMVARETGGEVTTIFSKLVETIRERKKIRERIKTLTFMAKLQGFVMGMLPIAFTYVVFKMDKSHFEFFLNDPMGRALFLLVATVQVVVFALMMRFSRTPM